LLFTRLRRGLLRATTPRLFLLFSGAKTFPAPDGGAVPCNFTYDVHRGVNVIRIQSLSVSVATHNNKIVKMGISGEKSRKKTAIKIETSLNWQKMLRIVKKFRWCSRFALRSGSLIVSVAAESAPLRFAGCGRGGSVGQKQKGAYR
ncbi:hypothetical protein, partial [Hyphococcus sp.]|uniref:hypothetical protein n=1 Tax=Hyphococcus sp. TaxID=2038636 RepID=UPI0035C708E6